jgi:hydrogenase maturation protease
VSDEVLVIGLGNPYRGDDAIGVLLARALRANPPPGARVFECGGEATTLLELWRGARATIVLDAVDAGAPPGTLLRLDTRHDPVPAQLFTCSTHAFGLAEAVALARTLGELPDALIIVGVQGCDFADGSCLSAPVAAAMDEALRRVREEVTRLREQQGRLE